MIQEIDFMRHNVLHHKRASLLVEALLFLALVSLIFIALSRLASQWEDAHRGASLASWWIERQSVAKKYLLTYAGDLGPIIDAAPGKILTIRDDTTTGLESLPANHTARKGLKAISGRAATKSVYGQEFVLYIYKTDADELLHGMSMSENGTPWITTGDAQRDSLGKYMLAANKARAVTDSAVVGKRGADGVPTADGNIYGLREEWSLALADVGLDGVPSATQGGQLAGTMEADIAENTSNVLYRDDVPDHPELNAMNTDLHMNGWEIDNSGTITISNAPQMTGGSGETGTVPAGGNGLVLDPIRLSGGLDTGTVGGHTVATRAQTICETVDAQGKAKPDGFIFTINNNVVGGSDPRDANGMYVCIGGRARQIADSGNSSSIKDITMVTSQAVIKKPVCPEGSLPQIYIAPVNFARAKEVPPVTAVRTFVENTTLAGSPAWRVRLLFKSMEDDIRNNFWVEEGRSWASLNPGSMAQPEGFNASGNLSTSYTNAMAFSLCVRTEGRTATDANYPNSIRTDTADGETRTNWKNSANGTTDRP